MHDLRTYDYAIVRVVPRVERGEFVNAGIILSCDVERILRACIELDEAEPLVTAVRLLVRGVMAVLFPMEPRRKPLMLEPIHFWFQLSSAGHVEKIQFVFAELAAYNFDGKHPTDERTSDGDKTYGANRIVAAFIRR